MYNNPLSPRILGDRRSHNGGKSNNSKLPTSREHFKVKPPMSYYLRDQPSSSSSSSSSSSHYPRKRHHQQQQPNPIKVEMRFNGFEKIKHSGIVDGWPRVHSARGPPRRKRSTDGVSSLLTGNNSNHKPKFLVELESFVVKELAELPPSECLVGSPSRFAIYQQAFLYFINEFTTYRSFLSKIRHEYEGMLENAQKELRVVPQLERKLATRQAEQRRVSQILQLEHAKSIEERDAKVELLDAQRRKLLQLNRELQSKNNEMQAIVDSRTTKHLELEHDNEVLNRALKRYDRDNKRELETKLKYEHDVEALRTQLKFLEFKYNDASYSKQLELDLQAERNAVAALKQDMQNMQAEHAAQVSKLNDECQSKVKYANELLQARNLEYETVLLLYEEAVEERRNTLAASEIKENQNAEEEEVEAEAEAEVPTESTQNSAKRIKRKRSKKKTATSSN